MKPTRPSFLLAVTVVAGVACYLLAQAAYGSLPPLPGYAPVSLVVLAVLEVSIAVVVRERLGRGARGRPARRHRPLHPIQVARAAVLAKASSPTGAALLGAYVGFFGWTFPRRGTIVRAGVDARICAESALAGLALVVAALVLERSCRTPTGPREDAAAAADLQSPP